MKKTIITPLWGALGIAALAILTAAPARAANLEIIDAPIARHGTAEAISIATNTYTKVAPTTRLSLQTTLLIDNPSTNTSTVHGHIGNCTSTSISTTTVKGPIEIAPASNGGYVQILSDECIWLVSRNGGSGAESVTIQPVSQRTGPP